jgi:flavin reductase (DIM6/NTAB) family NADH-FMN oxidoreductase RutF
VVCLDMQERASRKVGPDQLRQAFAAVPTGVSVITTAGEGGARGMTASAVCSVSLDPLLVLVCINNRSETLRAIMDNGTFAINVLHEAQAEVSSVFAGRAAPSEKFASVAHRMVNGSPVLDEALVWVTCDVHATAPGGDHTIVVGSVSATDIRTGEPLVRHAGRYRRLGTEAA